jgi:hypothetical protein
MIDRLTYGGPIEQVDSLSESVNPFTPESVNYETMPLGRGFDSSREVKSSEQSGSGLPPLTR